MRLFLALLSSFVLPALAPATSSAADWATYQGSTARSGVAKAPAFSGLNRAWSASVDGAVYAAPLIVGGRVYVATENNSVYAFSSNGRQLWRRHIGTPVAGSTLPCGNIDPSGITGTPAIDKRRHELFAVAYLTGHHHQLVGIDTRSGKLRLRKSADPGGMDPTVQQERGALLIAHHRIYIPYGGLFGDCGDYHGWVTSRLETGKGVRTYRNPAGEASIWAPGGISAQGGNLLVATGNGPGGFGFQNSVIRLSPTLKRIGFWAPRDWQSLSNGDVDVGSVEPLPISGGNVIQSGKNGTAYLLPPGLGGIAGETSSSQVCSGAYGAPAFSAPLVYLPCASGLLALRTDGGRVSVAWRAGGLDAGTAVVAGGLVWSIDRDTGRLHGFDPATGRERTTAELGSPITSFPAPAVSGSLMVAPAGHGVVGFRGI